ncbi:TIGR03752 family integrating conjugative element protein, partial [Morganella morganii]
MQIKSGILLKILVPVVVLVVTMIGVKSCGSQKSAQPQSGNTGAAELTREELRLLGIEGDTPQDTLRTLVGRIKTIQKN